MFGGYPCNYLSKTNLGVFGLQNSKDLTEQYKTEQHNTSEIFMTLDNFLFYTIFGGRNVILVF